ncbi:ATP-binding protein [Alkalihalobacterium elongatum]|uniref:ATP-binding protein n=1 Tax=Alkalihalobacterium elongatum TaxID=2675466 RepID=UPI001C1FA39F|nr:AAA family ATPase [Alkalihalobacterium elongatum]
MRIEKLHIYGYGKFYDTQINLVSPELQVIYGENERGKSTIKSFITTMLFGFPTKSQVGAHYEPKHGTKYGGKITLEVKELGEVTIERQKGKNGGKAIVFLENGNVGGEEVLQHLLGGMDKRLFTGIFSFSASDLQKIEQLKTEELNQYLHGASMLGKGSLNELEKRLEKNQQDLFKPSGKRPILNEKLFQLEDIKKSLKHSENQLTQYNELLLQRKDLEDQYIRVNNTINSLKERIKQQEKLKLIEPLYAQEKGISLQLDQLPVITDFPIGAIDTVKDSLAKEQTLKEQLIELEINLREKQQQVETVSFRTNFQQVKEQALMLQENSYEYERLKEELTTVELELRKINQLITDQLERLGRDWDAETILRTKTGLTAKEELKQLAQRERKSLYEREQLEVELKTKSLQLQQTKEKMKDIKGQCLSNEEKEGYEQKLIQAKDSRTIRKEIEQNMQWVKLQSERSENKNENSNYFILIVLLLLGIGGWLVYIQQWVIAILVFATAIFTFYMKNNKKESNLFVKKNIQEYEKKLENLPSIHELEREMEQIERILNENVAKLNQLEMWQKQLSQEEKGYSLILAAFETCENEIELIDNQLLEWCRTYQFGRYGNCEHQLSLFDLSVEVKQMINDQRYYKKRKQEICLRLEQIEDVVKYLAEELLIKERVSLALLTHKINEVIENEEKVRIQFIELKESIKKLNIEINVLKNKIMYLREERSTWLSKAAAKDEEEFFYFAKVATERQALEKELSFLRSQQAQLTTNNFTREAVIAKLEKANVSILEELEALNIQLAEKLEQQSALQKQIGRMDHEIEQIEAGTNHSQLLQTYELEKTEFQAKAMEWASFRMGELILKKAKSIYETERQPVVIQKAKELFSIMTNGEYVNLFAPVSENTFVVERFDGVRFSPDELSQGTGEQLYLSIRLALALAYQAQSPMPIILDDIMVNFDDGRKDCAKNVIEEVAKKHQVLFFTCHEQIKNLFHQEATMVLS